MPYPPEVFLASPKTRGAELRLPLDGGSTREGVVLPIADYLSEGHTFLRAPATASGERLMLHFMRQLGRLPLALRYEEDGMVGGVHIVDSEGPIASGTVDGDGTTWPLNLDPFVVRRDEPTVVFLGHTRQNDSELTVNMGFSNLGDDIENPDALFALSHLSVGKLIVPIGPQ